MSRPAIEDQKHELIKAAILDPDSNPLPVHLREELERTVQAAKLLDKNPVQKHAIAILRAKYPGLSRAQAAEDCRRAMRIFNSIHTFEYDWWQHWLLQDIAEMIQKAKEDGDLKAWAMGHKNLLHAIGERPENEIDAKLIEKHSIVIAVQVNNQTVNIDYNKFLQMPVEARKLITDQLNREIDDVQATEIMNS
jgi:hypothetical protein